jgi:hypothetical protein
MHPSAKVSVIVVTRRKSPARITSWVLPPYWTTFFVDVSLITCVHRICEAEPRVICDVNDVKDVTEFFKLRDLCKCTQEAYCFKQPSTLTYNDEIFVQCVREKKLRVTFEVVMVELCYYYIVRLGAAGVCESVWNFSPEVIVRITLVRSCPEGIGSFPRSMTHRIVRNDN